MESGKVKLDYVVQLISSFRLLPTSSIVHPSPTYIPGSQIRIATGS